MLFSLAKWKSYCGIAGATQQLKGAAVTALEMLKLEKLRMKLKMQDLSAAFQRWKFNQNKVFSKMLNWINYFQENRKKKAFTHWVYIVLKERLQQSNALWKMYMNALTQKKMNKIKQLLMQQGNLKLEPFLTKLCQQRLKSAFEAIKHKNALMRAKKSFLNFFVQKFSRSLASSFNQWKCQVFNHKAQDAQKLYKLNSIAAKLYDTYYYFYNQSMSKYFNIWKRNPKVMMKRYFLYMHEQAIQKINSYFNVWKLKVQMQKDRDKFSKVYNCLSQLKFKIEVQQREYFKRWSVKYTQKTRDALLMVFSNFEKGLRGAFHTWRIRALNQEREAEKAKNHDIYRLYILLLKYQHLGVKRAFQRLSSLLRSKDQQKTLMKLLYNLLRKQQKGMEKFKTNVDNFKCIQKVKSCIMQDNLKYKDGLAIVSRFFYRWKSSELLRQRRVMKKYLFSILFSTRLRFEQSAFWRWKYQCRTNYKYAEPKHLVLQKKLMRIYKEAYRKQLRIGWFYICLNTRQLSDMNAADKSDNGKYWVTEPVAEHVQRLAERYTPQPQLFTPEKKFTPLSKQRKSIEEQKTAVPIATLIERLRWYACLNLQQMLLKSVRRSFMIWKSNRVTQPSHIADRLSSQMDNHDYETLLKHGAARLLYENWTRINQRKLEKSWMKWNFPKILPKELKSTDLLKKIQLLDNENNELSKEKEELYEKNQELNETLQKIVERFDLSRSMKTYNVLKNLFYKQINNAFFDIKGSDSEYESDS